MANQKATSVACSNIAFIKYWGNRDQSLRLPLNDSLSMNLDALVAHTTVEFDDALDKDQVSINDAEISEASRLRIVQQLDRVRRHAQITSCARVASRLNFPLGTGLASSAAGFAALTLAATHAAGLELPEQELSVLARQGSGSACRSIPGGFVEWIASMSSATSAARSIAPADYWDLRDIVVVVTDQPKKVGSSEGHQAATSSPFMGERLSRLPARFHRAKRAILSRDLKALGPDLEAEAVELHTIAMTSRPPVYYWTGEMVRVVEAARSWRAQGLQVYFTLDAGPNVHLICEGKDAETVADQARALEVKQIIPSEVGGPAHLVEEALF